MATKNLFISTLFLVSLLFCACESKDAGDKPVDSRDKIVGLSDQFIGGHPYAVKVSKDFGTADGLILNGFDDIQEDVKAVLNGAAFDIPLQEINGEWIEGKGMVSADFSVIKLKYSNDGVLFSSEIKLNR